MTYARRVISEMTQSLSYLLAVINQGVQARLIISK
jgi:hypothetical protein